VVLAEMANLADGVDHIWGIGKSDRAGCDEKRVMQALISD